MSYRPVVTGEPEIRPRSNRRARLFAGGTYFRARDPGAAGNNISVQLVEWDSGGPQGRLVVTNHGTKYDENVIGPASVDLLVQDLPWDKRVIIDQLTTSPRASVYSIRSQISFAPVLEEVLGPFAFSTLFNMGSQLAVKLTPKTAEFTPSATITIKPRVRVYELVWTVNSTTPTDGSAPVSAAGWDPAALRAAIAEDPWIQMPARKTDLQDGGEDPLVLSAFPDTKLTGGDGLPETPLGINTGPFKSLVLINYGENPDGGLSEVNQMYEWVGQSATVGEWKKYG